MELYDVMRTTFAVREFTDDPLPDPVLYRIIDNAPGPVRWSTVATPGMNYPRPPADHRERMPR
jgi:hypothetical protein